MPTRRTSAGTVDTPKKGAWLFINRPRHMGLGEIWGDRRNGMDLKPGKVCGLSSRDLLQLQKEQGANSAMVSCQLQALRGTPLSSPHPPPSNLTRGPLPSMGENSDLLRKWPWVWTHVCSVQRNGTQCGQGQDAFPGRWLDCPPDCIHSYTCPRCVMRKTTRSH